MSTSKHVDKICIAAITLILIITILFMFGEKLGITVIQSEEDDSISKMFTENDLNAEWDASEATEIVLNGDSATISGNGAYFSDHTLHIVYAGKYVISGTLNGSIQIDADGDDKIWLMFAGVDITSTTDAPICINQADKVFLTLKENSQNTLRFENDDEDLKSDGCIFSKDDLTINGTGALSIESTGLHGIVCNDRLVFSGGNINITAKKDAVHAHDAVLICDTTLTVSAGDDGIHVGNDEESSEFYMESGNIRITECYEGIEANGITIAGGTVNIAANDDGINANGSGDAALITISGGDITIINKNGLDADGLDSNGSINISGGNLFVSLSGTGPNSAIDYGSENGGTCTISGGSVIACGSSQMAEGPDRDSAQGFIMQTVTGAENDTLCVLDASGEEIIRKEIPCSFTSVIISSPEISVGDTVRLVVGENETEITVSNEVENSMGGFGNPGGFSPGGENDQWGQNPPGNSNGGNMPSFPGGSGEDGNMMQMPEGDDFPSERPDIAFGSDFVPDGSSDTLPEMPDDASGQMQIPDGMQKPGGMEQGAENGMQMSIEDSNDQHGDFKSILVWVGTSGIILIIGLFMAIKKKY